VSAGPLRTAAGFLTTIGGAAAPDRRAVPWFPVVGAAVGLVVGGVWWGADRLWAPLVAATLAVAADAAVTGMLHLDGLADSADGLLPPLDRERRLEVMADPHAGVFAVVVVVLVLALRVVALASLTPNVLVVAGIWAASRAAMAVVLTTVPYARPGGGLASAFAGASPWPAAVAGAVGLAVAGVALGWPAGPAAGVALVIGSAAVAALARRRLGGFTGDVLGAVGVVGETCALLVAAAKW
jgi:adenosylcobinamide-GDP ribazoletransferase